MAKVKLEKLDLPKDEESIIKLALERGLDEISPKVLPENLTYQGLEDLVEEYGLINFQRKLKSLSEKEFLEEEEVDRVILCPRCGSLHVHSKFSCPKCGSVLVSKKELIEHSHCGYIGEIDDFEQGDRLVCPNCDTYLSQIDEEPPESGKQSYRVIGSSYRCEKCNHNFDRPHVQHRCTQCDTRFNYKRAKYKKLYTFKLTDKARRMEARPRILKILREMEDFLKDEEFEVYAPGELTGQSGVEQEFNLVANNGEESIVVDVSDGSQTDLISLLGKKIDVDAKMAVLVDMSGKITQTELASNQNISILDGNDEALKETLLEYIENIRAQTIIEEEDSEEVNS